MKNLLVVLFFSIAIAGCDTEMEMPLVTITKENFSVSTHSCQESSTWSHHSAICDGATLSELTADKCCKELDFSYPGHFQVELTSVSLSNLKVAKEEDIEISGFQYHREDGELVPDGGGAGSTKLQVGRLFSDVGVAEFKVGGYSFLAVASGYHTMLQNVDGKDVPLPYMVDVAIDPALVKGEAYTDGVETGFKAIPVEIKVAVPTAVVYPLRGTKDGSTIVATLNITFLVPTP